MLTLERNILEIDDKGYCNVYKEQFIKDVNVANYINWTAENIDFVKYVIVDVLNCPTIFSIYKNDTD